MLFHPSLHVYVCSRIRPFQKYDVKRQDQRRPLPLKNAREKNSMHILFFSYVWRCESEGEGFIRHIVPGDEFWVHYLMSVRTGNILPRRNQNSSVQLIGKENLCWPSYENLTDQSWNLTRPEESFLFRIPKYPLRTLIYLGMQNLAILPVLSWSKRVNINGENTVRLLLDSKKALRDI